MEIKWVIAHFFGRPIMQNEPSKRKRARFAVLEALLLIATYCALALIGSLYPLLAQKSPFSSGSRLPHHSPSSKCAGSSERIRVLPSRAKKPA